MNEKSTSYRSLSDIGHPKSAQNFCESAFDCPFAKSLSTANAVMSEAFGD